MTTLFTDLTNSIINNINNRTEQIKKYMKDNNLNIEFQYNIPFKNNAKIDLIINRTFVFDGKEADYKEEIEFLNTFNKEQQNLIFELIKIRNEYNEEITNIF